MKLAKTSQLLNAAGSPAEEVASSNQLLSTSTNSVEVDAEVDAEVSHRHSLLPCSLLPCSPRTLAGGNRSLPLSTSTNSVEVLGAEVGAEVSHRQPALSLLPFSRRNLAGSKFLPSATQLDFSNRPSFVPTMVRMV